MKLIVGLGNPTKEYDKTRHNIGFMVIDNYLGQVNWQNKFKALYYKKNIASETVYFVKPLTFMNLSGEAVREFVQYFNVDIKDILVIQDDLDESIGQYKLKKNSSSGGHNGIKNIIKELNSEEFLRLKIGINNGTVYNTIDFVLNKFSQTEIDTLEKLYPTFNNIIESFVINGIEKTMNIYNTK